MQEYAKLSKALNVAFHMNDIENLSLICGYHNKLKSDRSLVSMELQLLANIAGLPKVIAAHQTQKQSPSDTKLVLNFLDLPLGNPVVLENAQAIAQRLAENGESHAESWVSTRSVEFAFGQSSELHGVSHEDEHGNTLYGSYDIGDTLPIIMRKGERVADDVLRRDGTNLKTEVESALITLRGAIEERLTALVREPGYELCGEWAFDHAILSIHSASLDEDCSRTLTIAGTIDVRGECEFQNSEAYYSDPDGTPAVKMVGSTVSGTFTIRGENEGFGHVGWEIDSFPAMLIND